MQADKLKQAGIKQIACAAVAPASQLEEWAKKHGNANSQVGGAVRLSHALECVVLKGLSTSSLPHSQIALIADEDGGMTRMLGLDIPAKTGDESAAGPRSQR
jgi:peroxiredoxin